MLPTLLPPVHQAACIVHIKAAPIPLAEGERTSSRQLQQQQASVRHTPTFKVGTLTSRSAPPCQTARCPCGRCSHTAWRTTPTPAHCCWCSTPAPARTRAPCPPLPEGAPEGWALPLLLPAPLLLVGHPDLCPPAYTTDVVSKQSDKHNNCRSPDTRILAIVLILQLSKHVSVIQRAVRASVHTVCSRQNARSLQCH